MKRGLWRCCRCCLCDRRPRHRSKAVRAACESAKAGDHCSKLQLKPTVTRQALVARLQALPRAWMKAMPRLLRAVAEWRADSARR